MTLLIGIQSFGQNGQNTLRCGQELHYEDHLMNHPEVVQERQELENFTKNFVLNYNPNNKVASITIPVVFHVNDPNNPQKVTMAQVQSAIDILNEDFTATNWDIGNIRTEFSSIIANMDINFCLATKDPNGNATTGITYHYNNYNGREPDGYGTSVKSVEYWPGDEYLNIWIVNYVEDDNDLYRSGWAFLPDSWVASNNLDGIVYNHRYLGYTGSSDVSGTSSWQQEMARVLTHEVGHYLNLYHTFENYCSSPGDYVNDTPPVYYHGSTNCDQIGDKCSGVTVVNDQNYMDYTYCPSMFTTGQKARVVAALNSSVAGRNNLWTTGNLQATGCTTSTASLDEYDDIASTKLFPNPAHTEINLQFNLSKTTDLDIYIQNLAGQLVQSHSMTATGTEIKTISIDELKAGVYFVNVRSQEASYTLKLVKHK